MMSLNRRLWIVVLVVAGLVASGVAGRWSASVPVQAADAKDDPVETLLKKKLSLLRQGSEQMTQMFQNGRMAVDDALDWQLELSHAELDLCTTDEQRIAVLEKTLAAVKELEKKVQAQVQTAQATSLSAIKASVKRLDVEIALQQLKDG